MADFDSSLPVRTETDGDVKAVIVDPTVTTQQASVDANGRLSVVAYGNNGTTDVVLPIDPTSGALQVDIVDAAGITVDVDVQQFADNAAVNAADLGNLALGTDGSNYQIISVDSAGVVQVKETGIVQVSADGNANTALNPIYVENVAAGASSDDIHVFGSATDLAAASTTTITHTVNAGKTFCLKNWGASSSGKIKATLDVGGTDVDVGFNSTASPNIGTNFGTAIKAAAATVITLTIRNRGNVKDVYGFINGEEI